MYSITQVCQATPSGVGRSANKGVGAVNLLHQKKANNYVFYLLKTALKGTKRLYMMNLMK